MTGFRAPSLPLSVGARARRWGGRIAIVLLFGSLTLSLTAGIVYAVNLAFLPTSPEGLALEAENRCSARHDRDSEAWRSCLSGEPRPPSDEALPFLLAAAAAAIGGLALVVTTARGRLWALIPAVVIAGVVAGGSVLVMRQRGEDVDRLRARAAARAPTPVPGPTVTPPGGAADERG